LIRYWNIDITDEYFNQVCDIPINIQANIEKFLDALKTTKDPKTIGESYKCPKGNYIFTIYPGLPYEFIYHIDENEKTITLISCERLGFLDYGQTE